MQAIYCIRHDRFSSIDNDGNGVHHWRQYSCDILKSPCTSTINNILILRRTRWIREINVSDSDVLATANNIIVMRHQRTTTHIRCNNYIGRFRLFVPNLQHTHMCDMWYTFEIILYNHAGSNRFAGIRV